MIITKPHVIVQPKVAQYVGVHTIALIYHGRPVFHMFAYCVTIANKKRNVPCWRVGGPVIKKIHLGVVSF